jgi:hypothetical protein
MEPESSLDISKKYDRYPDPTLSPEELMKVARQELHLAGLLEEETSGRDLEGAKIIEELNAKGGPFRDLPPLK